MSESHYDALGVEPTASRDEMRDAYRARVDELTAARDRKGITESQLQDNRDEVARVRSAWSVLSDPFQRQRYDTQVAGGTPDVVDDDDVADASSGSEVELTGWRRLMAPPPQKTASSGGKGAGGKGAGAKGKQAPPPPRRQPTIPLPAGTQIAAPRVRGMALLFDLSIVLALFYAINILVPPLIQSDYATIRDQATAATAAKDAQGKIDDAKSSERNAKQAVADAEGGATQQKLKAAQSDLKSAQGDLEDAQQDFRKAQKTFNEKRADRGLPPRDLPGDSDRLQSIADDLQGEIRGTSYIAAGITLIVLLAYLVPITVRTGHTFGMRRRNIKVVRVDGSPVGWWPAFARFLVPLLIGVIGLVTVLGLIGPVVAFAMVLWGYRDPNGQGLHDKLARTLVVDA